MLQETQYPNLPDRMSLTHCHTLFSILSLSVLFISCTSDGWSDYTPLEHQLLLVWVAADQADSSAVRAYTATAVRSWDRLRSMSGELTSGSDETEALRLMDLWMLGLRNAVANAQANAVRTHLRHLHNQLSGLRPEYGIEDPLDLLYGFDARWEEVEAISHDQLLDLLEWQEYEDAFHRARENWIDFQRYPPGYTERSLPGLTANSGASESAGLELTRALDDFERLLTLADHTEMARASEAVRARFLDYLTVAVDYPPGAAAR